MIRYSDLCERAADFVRQHSSSGPVLVLAPTRTAADEVVRAACGNALLGVQRLAFRDLVLELAGPELYRRELVPVGRFVREALAPRDPGPAARPRTCAHVPGARISATLPLLQRTRPAPRRGRQRRHFLHVGRGPGVRRDGPSDHGV